MAKQPPLGAHPSSQSLCQAGEVPAPTWQEQPFRHTNGGSRGSGGLGGGGHPVFWPGKALESVQLAWGVSALTQSASRQSRRPFYLSSGLPTQQPETGGKATATPCPQTIPPAPSLTARCLVVPASDPWYLLPPQARATQLYPLTCWSSSEATLHGRGWSSWVSINLSPPLRWREGGEGWVGLPASPRTYCVSGILSAA